MLLVMVRCSALYDEGTDERTRAGQWSGGGFAADDFDGAGGGEAGARARNTQC
jgi:hypothetical protein